MTIREQIVRGIGGACAGVLLLGALGGAGPQAVDVGPGVTLILGAGGQLMLVPAEPVRMPVELPIVNNGFASDQDVAGPITPLVKALESANYQDRANATEALFRLPPGRLPDVVAAIKSVSDDEVVARLTDAAGHLFLKPRTNLKVRTSLLGVWFKGSDASLLGIKFMKDSVRMRREDAAETVTIMVTEIQPGFPAAQILRDGDRIVAIAGKDVPSGETVEDDFRAMVGGLTPGAVVPMTILRDGKLIEKEVQTTGVPTSQVAMTGQMIDNRMNALAAFLESLRKSDATARLQ